MQIADNITIKFILFLIEALGIDFNLETLNDNCKFSYKGGLIRVSYQHL